MLRPWSTSVLPFEIKKASLALRIESRLEKIFLMGISCMSLAVWLGEKRKCSAAVVGLNLVLGLSMVRRCSLNLSFKRRLVFSREKFMKYCRKVNVPLSLFCRPCNLKRRILAILMVCVCTEPVYSSLRPRKNNRIIATSSPRFPYLPASRSERLG